MRVQDLLRPLLEDFTLFAERVDKEFLSYIEREELYEGLRKAQELKERQQEPLKKLYCEWTEKSYRFLIDRWVCFEEYPSESFLRASGLKKSKNLSVWAILSVGEDIEGLTEGENELSKYVSKSLDELYVYNFAKAIDFLARYRGECGKDIIPISPFKVFKLFEMYSDYLLYDEGVMVIPDALMLRHIYNEFFDEHHATFSRILSDRLSQAIQNGRAEEHIRVIQTAIAVIKNDPESIPKGEPKSFVEKWLREELVI
jgi:hypothetical protein